MRVLICVLVMIRIFAGPELVADDQLRDAGTQSIGSRLASVKYVAIESREAFGACVILHANTPKQYEDNVTLVKKYHAERDAYNKEQELLEKRWREIKAQEPLNSEVRREFELVLQDRRRQYPRLRPYYLKDCEFFRVVGVGQDFIEVEETDNPDGTMLIPLSKLAKVVFPKRRPATK